MGNTSQGNRRTDLFLTHRLEALTDGIFAIAMTILVLSIDVPSFPDDKHPTAQALMDQLFALRRPLQGYVISFLLLGAFWILHQEQVRRVEVCTAGYLWRNMIGLLFVCIVPFSTELVSEYGHLQPAAVLFEINILLIGLTFWLQWRHADAHHLFEPAFERKAIVAATRANLALPVVSLLAIGMAFFLPDWSTLVYMLTPWVASLLGNRGKSAADSILDDGEEASRDAQPD